MTGSFILDYYLLVFLASCGVFQMVAACKGLIGMLFLKYRSPSFLLGLALLVGSFSWFFLAESRNVSDSARGLNGNEQFAYFFAGSGTSLAFTLVLTSLIYWKLGAACSKLGPGLDALKQSVYLDALSRTWRYLRTGDREPWSMTPGSSITQSLTHCESSFRKPTLVRRMITRLVSQTRRIGVFWSGTS